ncbi:YD repeat-containing protein [Melghirimyces profundicolus]|uniref:YD repeat-containing protein n=1 Tax=Melghirimyces profundicolus TaxID=1242148 RepID=A0A2T6AVZ8_9BACL|nr:YD repeat-containing protein [Melghirimyces profundicolus]
MEEARPYPFKAGNTHKITLTDDADGIVVADVVKLVRDHSGETDTEQKDFTYDYDPNGNLTTMTDNSSGAKVDTYAITYNGLNQVAKVEEKKDGVVQNTTSYTYDPNGNPLKRTHDDQIAEYAYDVRDLVEQVTNKKSASDPEPKVTTFTYTPRGQKLKETKANGNTVDRTRQIPGIQRHRLHRKAKAFLLPFQASQIRLRVMNISRCHIHIRDQVVFAVHRPVIQVEKSPGFPLPYHVSALGIRGAHFHFLCFRSRFFRFLSARSFLSPAMYSAGDWVTTAGTTSSMYLWGLALALRNVESVNNSSPSMRPCSIPCWTISSKMS